MKDKPYVKQYEVISVSPVKVAGLGPLDGCFKARYYDKEWVIRDLEVHAHDELAAWQISKYIVRKFKPSPIPQIGIALTVLVLCFITGAAFGAGIIIKPQEVQHEAGK